MGKHFWWGIGLLGVLLAVTWGISMAMDTVSPPICGLLDQAQEAADGQLDRARELVVQAKDQWQQAQSWISAVADHTPMDQIRELFAEAELFGKGDEPVHFSTVCARLSSLLRDMAQAHKLTLQNLF